MVGSSLDDNKPCEVASHLRVQMLSYELNPQNQKTYKLLIPVYVMKKEESKEKKSLLDKLTIPVIKGSGEVDQIEYTSISFNKDRIALLASQKFLIVVGGS